MSETPTELSSGRKKHPVLENWAPVFLEGKNYFLFAPPGRMFVTLRGKVYGHPNPKWADGQEVTTSPLISLDTAKKIARTKNTEYALGDPDPKFLMWLESMRNTVADYNFCREDHSRRKKAI